MKRTTRILPPALALAAGIAIFGACSAGEGTAIPGAGDAQAAENGFGGGLLLPGLTIQDLDSRLQLSDTQRDQMQEALEKLSEGRRGLLSDGRLGRGEGPRMGEPPAMAFLETASRVLTPDQFAGLARLAAERRDEFFRSGGPARLRERMHDGGRGKGRFEGGFGGGPGRLEGGAGRGEGRFEGGFGGGPGRELNLTDEQREEIRSYVGSRGDDLREIHEQLRSGALTAEQARSKTREFREGMRRHIHDVLTPEQREKAEAMRSKRVGERVDWRLSHMDEHLNRRAEFLGRVLGLSEDQAAEVRSLLVGSMADRNAALEGVRSGTIDRDDAMEQIRMLENSLAGKIEATLTPEQKARFDAIRELVPMPLR